MERRIVRGAGTSASRTTGPLPGPPPKGTDLGDRAAAGEKFLTAFGRMGGVWFAQGKTFDQAKALFESSTLPEVVALRKDQQRTRQNLGPNLAKVALGMKMPPPHKE